MTNLSRKTFRLVLLVAFVWLIPLSCEKWQSSIPWVRVNIPPFLISSHIELYVSGNYIPFPTEGYGGIILFRTTGAIPFVAYDAACPYDISNKCSLLEKGSIEGGIATCPCCGSKFNLWDYGSVLKGPANEPLKQYRVDQLNDGMRLWVHN